MRTFIAVLGFVAAPAVAEIRVEFFRLLAPDGREMHQASDLHDGRIGERDGFWIVCDRNGGPSAGRIYFISRETLARAEHRRDVRADEAFVIAPPAQGWAPLEEETLPANREMVAEIRKRIAGDGRTDEPYLDLEAVTIAPALAGGGVDHLFVVAEEPHSAILELALPAERDGGRELPARLVSVHAYREKLEEQGTALNDGLEGLAYAGRPGVFYFAEEGTREHTGRATGLLLFRDPLLGVGRLERGELTPDAELSAALTKAVQGQRQGAMQTLNGLARLRDGRVLALDRNGGLIVVVDPARRTARPWLNLHDMDGQDLRKLLAEFPGKRRMPYVSMEGLAVDPDGVLWLVDDPAMPEAFHNSCLIRILGVSVPASGPGE